MDEAHINTKPRIAAFLAQLAHESGEFRYMEEIWGPTDAQKRYEPPSTLATRLGNTQPGDGFRFKGRGPIQLTGRANYVTAGKALGLPLSAQPELAATPEAGFRVAAWFWTTKGLNALADAGQFDKITLKINGGTNGAEERRKYYLHALAVLKPQEHESQSSAHGKTS
jgi:predicted chitinase